jgi:hypothetical protein
MTNEQVMQMMTDMGLYNGGMENWIMDNAWFELANKSAEMEREACAKLCEGKTMLYGSMANKCAAAIRQRGEK